MLSVSGPIRDRKRGGGEGGVLSASGPIQKAGGLLRRRGGGTLYKRGVCNSQPNPPPPYPSVSTPVQGIHEDNLEWYVTLVVYTHASLKSDIMETEQQSDDQSV